MKLISKKILGVLFLATSLAFFGCVYTDTDVKNQIMKKDAAIKALESSNQEKEGVIEQYKGKLSDQEKATEDADRRATEAMMAEKHAKEAMKSAEVSPAVAPEPLLPPNAKAGECYARVFVPPRYQTTTERLLAREASERVETIPARYETVKERVLVSEASNRLEEIPAQYKWVEERVLVREPSKRLVQVPAEYNWVEDKVLVKEAHTDWKSGRGLIEKVDNATGEIMCLVEIPATYKTVKKRVLVKSATVREVDIPPEYKTVKKRVLVKPATAREIEIPASYSTIEVTKMVSPPNQKRIPIPAEYQNVTKTERVSEGHMEWKRVLCETNVSSSVVTSIQRALLNAGHSPGVIDGIIGEQTNAAINAYQKEKNLAAGGLTYETIKSLGVRTY